MPWEFHQNWFLRTFMLFYFNFLVSDICTQDAAEPQTITVRLLHIMMVSFISIIVSQKIK